MVLGMCVSKQLLMDNTLGLKIGIELENWFLK